MLLDVQDLLQFLHHHGSVSGIQRVQLGILAAVLAGEAGPHGGNCLAVFPSLIDDTIWAPRAEDLSAIIAFCSGSKLDPHTAKILVETARHHARRVMPAPGMGFLVLGAFWFFAGATRFYARLRAQGVRLGVLIYDMFPATHPEYTTADTTLFFNQSLNEGLFFWDFGFAISEYSAAAFRRTAAERGYPSIETVAIPLAHSFGLGTASPPEWLDTWPAALGDLQGRDYIVSVSTIEARKNHQLLFHAWKRMIDAGRNPPPLVLVGRPGWRVGDFMAQLQATRNLDGRIMVVHGLSDAELEAVYRGCLFTVMPSYVEGWGLAVGESLSFGRPCIAANTSALPEVGGDLVAYADPGSVPEWVEKLSAWLDDRAALAEAEARIRREFTPRRWPEVARHLLGEAARMMALPPRAVPHVAQPLQLKLGQLVMAGIAMASSGLDANAAQGALSQAVSLDSGWYPTEAGCTWMRGRLARFVATTDAPPGTRVEVTLELNTPPWPIRNTVTLQVGGGEPVRLELAQHASFSLAGQGVVAADGRVGLELRLDLPGEDRAEDPRRLCLAMRGITLRPAPAVMAPAAAPERPPVIVAAPVAALPAPGFFHPARRLLRQANQARDAQDWTVAARLYSAYLAHRPRNAAIMVQHGNMLSMAGEHAAALQALADAWRLGDAAAPAMFRNALSRFDPRLPGGDTTADRAWISPGHRRLIDLTTLLDASPRPESWGARRWRLGLAQALLDAAGEDSEMLLQDSDAGVLRLLPRPAARLLLAATQADRPAMLAQFAAPSTCWSRPPATIFWRLA